MNDVTDEQIIAVRKWDWICAACKNWGLYCDCFKPVVCRCDAHGCAAMIRRIASTSETV